MIFYSHRRFRKLIFRGIAGIFLAGVVIIVSVFAYGLLSKSRPAAKININYYYNNIGSSKVVALTFDDGPSPGRTEAIMEVLKRENVPATFFFIGSRALRYPDLVRQADANGFEIGNHSFTHSETVQTSAWRLRLELNLADAMIETVTHKPVSLYRPPFLLDIGSDPTTVLSGSKPQLAWAVQDGYVVVGADVDPKDWLASSPQEVVDNLVQKLDSGGHLILLHDGSSEKYTVAALEGMIKELRARGYTFTTASDLLGLDAAQHMAITQDLKPGAFDVNAQGSVTALQEFLIMNGYVITDQGGTFGASTQRSVIAWQAAHGIFQEGGWVGPITRQAITLALTATTYQPLPPSHTNNILLFSTATRFYTALSPIVATTIIWLVKIVLVLVALRLILTLLLRAVAAVNGPARLPAWDKRVSVIIPAYNEEDNIGATVESVLDSTFENLEVIVINDGSKDGTAAIVHAIEKNNPKRVRLYNIQNGGKARALNYGCKLAHNEIVIMMDGDTIFDRYTIARLVRHFHDPTVAAVAGKVCATRSRNILNLFQSAEYVITQNVDKQAFDVINAIGVVPGPVGAWRKSVVLALGGYSLDTLVEDQDLTMAILAAGHRVVYEPRAQAYSETPFRVKDFFKQRSRWIFGTIQCLWKYKRFFFSFKRPALGWAVLPNTFFFSILLSLLIPLMDFLLIVALVVGFARSTIILYIIFTSIDFAYAALGFGQERQKRWLIVLLPLQRLFYRVVIFIVVWRSVIKAIEGASPNWNKVRKRGDAHAYHLHMLNEAATQVAVTVNQK